MALSKYLRKQTKNLLSVEAFVDSDFHRRMARVAPDGDDDPVLVLVTP
jgi:hypothetical protein